VSALVHIYTDTGTDLYLRHQYRVCLWW